MSTASSQAFAWPIVTLDFEASGLGPDTYPIEIGVARWHGPGTSIRMWSTLIAPTREWLNHGDWQERSESVHGIRRAALDGGMTPAAAMAELNRICPLGTLALIDGGHHDRRWMQKLADAAGIAPALLLGSWAHLVTNLDQTSRDRLTDHGIDHEDAHRAGPDARDNLVALAHAIGAPRPATVPWSQCRQHAC